jgi:hypothetical protein
MPDKARDPTPTVLIKFRLDIPLFCVELIFIEPLLSFGQFLFFSQKKLPVG